MREGLGVGEIVGRHDLDAGPVEGGTENIASDPAESVDANFDCHLVAKNSLVRGE
jgi:hypothetical protein